MYCEKCGTKNNKNDNFCKSCGEKLKQENIVEKSNDNNKEGILTISIVSIVFSLLLWPVGLVLSIITAIKYKKLKKENYENLSVLIINIISFILCFIEFIITIVTIFVIFFTFSVVSKEDDKVFGNYTCYMSKYSQIPVVSATFKDKTFSWAKYGDEEDNVLMGKYITNKREIKNGTMTYELKLTPNYYEADNKVKLNKHYTVTIVSNGNDKANISFENGSTYYCDKIGD